MSKARVLFVSQEITPYLPESHISHISRFLPQGIQELGKEIRTFMPRFGKINERRYQLHEVIRLSGMNLIINDTDHPLIIKVSSIQAARMQVYFIDNEDYFQRKFTLRDEKGKYFDDNDERAIFFARGVLETVKKLRWSPDVIHCHGWFTALIPLYLKRVFKDDALFQNAKIIFSLYDDDFEKPLNKDFKAKLFLEGIEDSDTEMLKEPSHINLIKMAIKQSDGVILGSENISEELIAYTKENNIPLLDYQNEDSYIQKYSDFYDQMLEN